MLENNLTKIDYPKYTYYKFTSNNQLLQCSTEPDCALVSQEGFCASISPFQYCCFQSSLLGECVVELARGLYSYQLLNPSECELLCKSLRQIANFGRVGVNLIKQPGYEQFLALVVDYFSAFVLRAYCYPPDTRLEGAYIAAVSYSIGKDTSHPIHIDDSDVTLNLCLGESFEGGELVFGQRVVPQNRGTLSFSFLVAFFSSFFLSSFCVFSLFFHPFSFYIRRFTFRWRSDSFWQARAREQSHHRRAADEPRHLDESFHSLPSLL
jgi:hypothetical protein